MTNTANQIKIGDVIFSKKHNYKVTVEAITTNNELVCAWFDKDNDLHREILSLEDVEIKNQI